MQTNLMQLINLYFLSDRNKSLLKTALFSFSWKLMTVCAVGFYRLLVCQEAFSTGTLLTRLYASLSVSQGKFLLTGVGIIASSPKLYG